MTTMKIGPRVNHGVARQLPPTMSSLCHPRYKTKSDEELYNESEHMLEMIKFSEEDAEYLAEATKMQSESLIWFEHRKGRITASHFGAVCKTSVQNPSKTLIEAILQKKTMPKIPALEWGKSKEDTARKAYVSTISHRHSSFEVKCTGLHLNTAYPHLGASPDGIVCCSCCGPGLLEIKCPFSKQDVDPTSINDPNFYLKHTSFGVQLYQKHNYYKQVQGQLYLCNYAYCDFVCWTPVGLHVERIQKDPSIFLEMEPILTNFFLRCILPHVLRGGDFVSSEDVVDDVYCFCQRSAYGQMIACDNPSCPYEWFHFSCVAITDEPDGDWFCSHCK